MMLQDQQRLDKEATRRRREDEQRRETERREYQLRNQFE
jgi:hypothetical protein